MLVTITNVEIEKHPKGYSIANVFYNRDGKDETRKIMSFAQVETFKTLSHMRDFPQEVNIVLVKNAKTGYWDWIEIERNVSKGEVSSVEAKSTKPAGRVLGSNYETSEERAKRQVYIIRQSSISSAIAFAAAVEPKGITKDRQALLEDAKAFEAFVMETGEPTTSEVV